MALTGQMEVDMLDAGFGEVSDHASARLLRLRDVQHRVGLGRSTIYRWMEEAKFPRPHPIGDHSVRWLESDIDAWIVSKTSLGNTK
jgi:prophage regulatory protein